MAKNVELLGVKQALGWDDNAGLVARNSQLITDDFKQRLADDRAESTRKREGNFMRFAVVPNVFIDKWKREGFDALASGVQPKDIVKRLVSEGLEGFLTTNKRVA